MTAAVIGGGINGVMTAWALRRRGHEVVLFERHRLMGATSSASTKLLHGGVRYLEQGEFRLVREALHERAWWLQAAPALCHPIRLLLPVRRHGGRPRWMLRAGLALYDLLAGSARIQRHQWIPVEQLEAVAPGMRTDGLLGAFAFWDGQMDDHQLGRWAAAQAQAAGVEIHEQCDVRDVREDGHCTVDGVRQQFDVIVNCAGPWAEQLLVQGGLVPKHHLDLVRGSHLVVDRPCPVGILAEVPDSRRIAFVLPWQGRTLVGTTEVRQPLDEPIACSAEEAAYLRRFHDGVMREPLAAGEVVETFAGVRPLIRSADDPSRATREYEVDRHGRVLTVYGGKWTTARALGERVAALVERGGARR